MEGNFSRVYVLHVQLVYFSSMVYVLHVQLVYFSSMVFYSIEYQFCHGVFNVPNKCLEFQWSRLPISLISTCSLLFYNLREKCRLLTCFQLWLNKAIL